MVDRAVLRTVMTEPRRPTASLRRRSSGSRLGTERVGVIPLLVRITNPTTIAGRFAPIRGGSQPTGAFGSQLVTFSEVP